MFSCAVVVVALVGCGGGGGSSSALPATVALGSAPVGTASVAFTIAIPSAATASSTRRSPRYVSAGTKSAVVDYAGAHQIADCSSVCSISLTVPAGPNTFHVSLYDGAHGTGNVLSTGSASATIVQGVANNVSVTFDGVVASVGVALGVPSVATGTAATIPVTVTAKDAAGFTIIGPDAYSAPIALRTDDTSGATSLSATSVAAPTASVSLAYNGSAAIGAVRVTASVPSTSVVPQTVTLAVQRAAAPANAADHVRSLAYFGLNGVNAAIPASYMAQHVDIVEDDGFTADHARAFKQAGGAMAETYTDPTYVPYCVAPFSEPAGHCSGPIGKLVANDPSAWVHDASGARIDRATGTSGQFQEMLNVGSPAAQLAYAQTTASIFASTPQIDIVEADDSGGDFTVPGLGTGSNYYGGWSGNGTEIASDAAWIAGETAMLAAAGRPVIVNGSSVTQGPAYGGAFLDQTNVLGQMFEGYMNNAGGYLYGGAQFAQEQNGVLAVQSHRKWAVVQPTGAPSPANRLFAYAAWLLVYDPQYSVYAQVVPQSDGFALYPEMQLVAAQPRTTAPSDVAALAQGAVYVREFASCSIAGSSIGACAAIVNASAGSATVPSFAAGYTRQIALDAASLYTGGKVNVVAGAPAALAPKSAAILVR